VAVKRAPAAGRKFLNVAAIGCSRKTEAHDLHTFTLHWIIIESERIDIRDQIAFPRTHSETFVLLKELPLRSKPVAELKGIAKDKIIVVKQIDDMGRVGAPKKTHRLIRSIEVLIGDIERNREDRSGAPLESLFGILFEPNRRRPAPFVDVDERLEQVPLWIRLLARRYLANVGIGLLLFTKIQKRPKGAHPFP
jgi:hypothetical protein